MKRLLMMVLILSGVCLADSTDIKRIDKKLSEIDNAYKLADQKINELQQLKIKLEGMYEALKEERKIADQKLKKKQ